jgi:hypothetical protein
MKGEIGDYLYEVIVIENGQKTQVTSDIEAEFLNDNLEAALENAQEEPVIIIKVIPK